ncbi:hypothetical protein G6O67_005240 [Ophiocordyceps sinensis]|uniref:Uncharacterized protein n=1 Tax=Ophiocordyceps sinensis TaxID=72228 RepID=A0A8H4PR09_9HYPO|nr:hypothetical protein G6O67_005240 [Ophiocordyceps sinensis]
MASPETTPAASPVDAVFALSDAELADLIRKNNGDYESSIDDCDHEPLNDQRHQLAERLKALACSRITRPRPLNLDELDACLRKLADGPDQARLPTTLRWRVTLRSPTVGIDMEAMRRESETKAYHDLLDDGGRPYYPIVMLDQVLRNPDVFAQLLRPWHPHRYKGLPQGRRLDDSQVFESQLERWGDFGRWQRDNRDIEDDDDGGFPAFVERVKQDGKGDYRHDHMDRWANGSETGNDALAGSKAVDRLTTWIEYLNFEYWWLDWYTETPERLKPDLDRAWQELVDMKVLWPDDTQKSVRRWGLLDGGESSKAVRQAKLKAEEIYNLTQLDPERVHIPEAKRISMMEAATTRLNAAKAWHELDQKRNKCILPFIRRTTDLRFVEEDVARQRILLRWVLDDVPLVEAEMAQAEADKAGPRGIERRKRSLATEEDHTRKPGSKRQKLEPKSALLSRGATG